MPKKHRPPPRAPAPAPSPALAPDVAPVSAHDASSVGSCHQCAEYKLAIERPSDAIKVLASAPAPGRFLCAIEALGVLLGWPVFTVQAHALIKAGAVDVIERCVRDWDADYTIIPSAHRPVSTLHRLATLVGNAIRHFGHTCAHRPPSAFSLAELEALAARLRKLAKEILAAVEPGRIEGTHFVERNGKRGGEIDANSRWPFAAFMNIMLEPEIDLVSALTAEQRVNAARVVAYQVVDTSAHCCRSTALEALARLDRRGDKAEAFSLWTAVCGSDPTMAERLFDAVHRHAQHARTKPRPDDATCLQAAQGLAQVLSMFQCHASTFDVATVETWLDRGLIGDIGYAACETARIHSHLHAANECSPACGPHQLSFDLVTSTLQRVYGSPPSGELLHVYLAADVFQLLAFVGPDMQRQAVNQPTREEDDQMRAFNAQTGRRTAVLLPEGVRPALLAIAAIVRERDDAELRRACAFRLRPSLHLAILRLQNEAATDEQGKAAFELVIEAWRALARLVGVQEERRCGEPSCRSKPKRMHLCASCKALFYCSQTCAKQHWPVHRVICGKQDAVAGPVFNHGHGQGLYPRSIDCYPVGSPLRELFART